MTLSPVRAALAALWLIVAFVAASCGPAGEPSLVRSAWPETLVGTTWTAVRVGDQPTVAGSQPTAAFTADQVKGRTGCNNYFGKYEYAKGVITFTQTGSTAAACPDATMGAIEQRFLAAMAGASSVSIDPVGRMILDGSGGSITFEVAPQQTS
jgi:heat shock protein HslJ